MASIGDSPPAKRRRIVDSTSIGSPLEKEELLDVQTIQTKIYNFADLPQGRGFKTKTCELTAHDLTWRIALYPRGCRASDEDAEYVSVFLHCDINDNNKTVKAEFTIELGLPGAFTKGHVPLPHTFSNINSTSASRGFTNFAKRQDVLSKFLDDEGTLEINIDIQIYGRRRVWYPKPDEKAYNPFGKRLLESGAESDVTFIVGEEKETFHAHKIVIAMQAPVLYELVQNSQVATEISIPKIRGPIFKVLLEHIYTGILPKVGGGTDNGEHDDAKLLLGGADTFGLTKLKLQIESELLSKFLTTDTAADLLLFSDAHCCPLLKEACFVKCKDNMSEVMKSADWNKVKESSDLMSELLLFASGNNKRVPKDSNDYDNMSVRKLREELASFDLDLDGTKEMLIQRLKDNDSAAADERQEESD